jgi:hypothetical protein
MNVLLVKTSLDLSGVRNLDDVTVARFSDADEVAAALDGPAEAAVLVSDDCSDELRARLANLIRGSKRRVIEVQGKATVRHGNELSAACTGVIAGFGVEAGVSAALAVLKA